MQSEWYDDTPMCRDNNERMVRELAQLNPHSEWFTFAELMALFDEMEG